PGFDPAQIPSGIGEALDKHWEQLPPPRRETERRLLTALAYAQGPGLDDDTWLVFAQALGRSDVTITDLDVLRHSASADYLLETLPPGTDGRGPVTRLFHQALADQLLADRNTRQSSDQNLIVDALLAHAAGHGWSGYGLDYAAHHAAAAHRLDELLDDLDYLLAVDPPHLLPYLNAAQGDDARLTASTYRQTAHVLTTPHRDVRASQLELTAHRLGHHHLADHITQTTPHRPWKTTWSHGKKTTDHLILTGHT